MAHTEDTSSLRTGVYYTVLALLFQFTQIRRWHGILTADHAPYCEPGNVDVTSGVISCFEYLTRGDSSSTLWPVVRSQEELGAKDQ